MSRKVLVTGASGLLGRAIYKEFCNDASWEVLGLAFSRTSEKLKKVDLTNFEEVNQVMTDFKPDVVVHSAAERKPDVVEQQPEATKKLNVHATQKLCQAAAKIGAWVVYISTDYVFDGKNPPYKEDAQPSPLNKYGMSKLEGEQVTLDVSPENSVFRVPVLYGYSETLSEGAVTVLFEKVKDTTKNCIMNDYERRYPTHCGDIAVVIRQLSERRLQDPKSIKGIYHWSGNENMTKYDMAITMATVFGLPTDHIKSDKTPSSGAARPFNSHLDCGRVKCLGFGQITSFKDGIADVLKSYAT